MVWWMIPVRAVRVCVCKASERCGRIESSNLAKSVPIPLLILLSSNHVIWQRPIDFDPGRLDLLIELCFAQDRLNWENQRASHAWEIFGLHAVADMLLTQFQKNVGEHFNVWPKHAKGLVNHCWNMQVCDRPVWPMQIVLSSKVKQMYSTIIIRCRCHCQQNTVWWAKFSHQKRERRIWISNLVCSVMSVVYFYQSQITENILYILCGVEEAGRQLT